MKKLYIISLLLLTYVFQANAQYITVWKTDNPGIAGNNTITIPATGTNYNISWEEEANPSNTGTSTGSGLFTLTLPSAGIYKVTITPGSGTFTRITFADTGDKNKLLEIRQWGDTPWESMSSAYLGCSNLIITATDSPVLDRVTSLSRMFESCTALTTVPGMDTWNVNTITDMSGMFCYATNFNGSVSDWDVSNVTNMSRMFHSTEKFNQPIGIWDVSKVKDMNSMFYQTKLFDQPIGNWNVAAVTNMSSMFCLSKAFNQPIRDWNVAGVTNMSYMFYTASKFNQPLSDWNVSQVKNMSVMFHSAASFNQSLGQWSMNAVTTLADMLSNSGMGCASMALTLIGWADNPATPVNIQLGATNRNYGSQAIAAKATLETTKNWTMRIGSAITCTLPVAPYVTLWKTDNEGTSNANQIIIPATGTNYSISWVDVNNSASIGTATGTDEYTLTFPAAGTYRVSISQGGGTFDRIAFSGTGDRNKLLRIEQWGQTRWTSMEQAYSGCENLVITAADVPNLTGVTSTNSMFQGCSSLTTVPGMNNWDVSNVTDMGSMFSFASLFNEPVGNWNVSNVIRTSGMFGYAQTFNQPIGSWNVNKVTNMGGMFEQAIQFNQPIGAWDVQNVTRMSSMFDGAENFDQPIGLWDVSKVNRMSSMFNNAGKFNQPIGNWNLGNVTNMNLMFANATAFNQPIGDWNVSNVETMDGMFNGALSFNQPIGSWNVGNVSNMSTMFSSAAAFNQPIGNWNVANLTQMSGMFAFAVNFNQQIETWDVHNATNMAATFEGADNFNQPLGQWDMSQVTDISSMFKGAASFNQNIGSWNVSNVNYMEYMFESAARFNKPVNDWDVSNVIDMHSMFASAGSFNQSLAAWNLTNVTDMAGMMSGSGIDCVNLSLTLQSWAANSGTPDNITFDADGRDYSKQAKNAFDYLVNTKNWTIGIGSEIECSALPVSLVRFVALSDGQSVQLSWSTTSEIDHDYFEIERSTDTRNWKAVIRTKGSGTSYIINNYTETDVNPVEGISYYRLKIVDFAGNAEYSMIRAVNNKVRIVYNVYPNPATTSITLSGKTNTQVRIYNFIGQQVIQTGMKEEKTVIPVDGLPVGIYVIRSDDGWNSKFVKK